VSKRISAPYRSRLSRDWLKTKNAGQPGNAAGAKRGDRHHRGPATCGAKFHERKARQWAIETLADSTNALVIKQAPHVKISSLSTDDSVFLFQQRSSLDRR
jgi:hypothetical protein